MFAMRPLKYVLVFVALISPYASSFLYYLLPTLSYWLLWIFLACLIPIFFFFLGALLRRDLKAVAILSATWTLAFLPFSEIEPVAEIRFWILVQGFRIHASPVEDYLSKCSLTEFVEKGVRQKVGECERSGYNDAITYVVLYDTTGELASPASQRTAEWKDAMWDYPPRDVLRDGEGRAVPLFGNFYQVGVLLEEAGG
jgi:hypothetical protein